MVDCRYDATKRTYLGRGLVGLELTEVKVLDKVCGWKQGERETESDDRALSQEKVVRCVPLAATEEDERVLTWVREADRA